VLDAFEESIAAVRSLLPKFDDAAMSETWRLVAGGQEVLAQPRGEFLHDVMLSHWYQHRGQFSVYLRLLNIAVPSSWDRAPTNRRPSCKRCKRPNSLCREIHVPILSSNGGSDRRKCHRDGWAHRICRNHDFQEKEAREIPQSNRGGG